MISTVLCNGLLSLGHICFSITKYFISGIINITIAIHFLSIGFFWVITNIMLNLVKMKH